MYARYYKILDIPADADEAEIKKAFRLKAKKYHPDINTSPDAAEIFHLIFEAYEVLINKNISAKNKNSYSDNDLETHYKEELRKKARAHAQMKYEKFTRQHEAFKNSGFYDLSLIFKIIGRVFIFVFTLFLFTIPIIFGFKELKLLLLGLFCWPLAVFQAKFIFDNRTNYFLPEKFYYNFNRIKNLLQERQNPNNYKCFYCKGLPADSRSVIIYLLRVKNIKTETRGPLQHKVNYNRNYKNIKVPRSRKAFRVHLLSTTLKLLIIVFCPFLLNVESILWRLVFAFIIASSLSFLIGMITKTKIKSGYLINRFFIAKASVWILVLLVFTNFKGGMVNLSVHEIIYPVYGLMVFFDPVLELIIKIPGHALMFKPLISDYQYLNNYFEKKYQYHIDIPLWTLAYPFIKWIFG